MLKNKNNLEFLYENSMLRSKFEDDSGDDIFIKIRQIGVSRESLFVTRIMWKIVDFPMPLAILPVKFRIFHASFYKKLCMIFIVTSQSIMNSAFFSNFNLSQYYKKLSKSLKFRFECLFMPVTSWDLAKVLFCIYLISSQRLKPHSWISFDQNFNKVGW